MRPVRNSAKAIIVKDSRLLAIKNRDADGDWYCLPGGGQEPGETLTEALRRECLEEVGVEVMVGPLRFVREYIGKNHEFHAHDSDVHQVDFMFECEPAQDSWHSRGSAPDALQVGTAWLRLDELHEHRIYPSVLRTVLLRDTEATESVYLGDIN